MRLLSVQMRLLSVRKWLPRENSLTVTFAKKFTKKKNIFGNQSGPSDVCVCGHLESFGKNWTTMKYIMNLWHMNISSPLIYRTGINTI